MSTWLYQMNQQSWPPQKFRCVIWEKHAWNWGYGTKRGGGEITAGDTLVFFYSPSGGNDPGIYGWAVITQWDLNAQEIYFTPATPTDYLKMDPWWDASAKKIVNDIRGKMTQATLFHVPENDVRQVRDGIKRWLHSKRKPF
jgi:hypothetical protein